MTVARKDSRSCDGLVRCGTAFEKVVRWVATILHIAF